MINISDNDDDENDEVGSERIVMLICDDENVDENDSCDYVDRDEKYDGRGLIQLIVHRLNIDET